ncbi:MAG: pantetheine-phosphate adenylyltransferase [Anaerolineales bacterium]|nr:pantetheine-phosphate adenylyltransferase [Anaerolineales bacterium]
MVRAVFPGSFDPVHNGHIDIARRAANIFEEVIVAVYDKPQKDLLFTPQERLELVNEAFRQDHGIRATLFSGLTVDFCRKNDVQVIVRGLRVFSDFEHEFRMALANHHLAPEIEVVALITSEDHSFLSGSTVKEIASLGGDVREFVPEHVRALIVERFKDGKNSIPISSLRD